MLLLCLLSITWYLVDFEKSEVHRRIYVVDNNHVRCGSLEQIIILVQLDIITYTQLIFIYLDFVNSMENCIFCAFGPCQFMPHGQFKLQIFSHKVVHFAISSLSYLVLISNIMLHLVVNLVRVDLFITGLDSFSYHLHSMKIVN